MAAISTINELSDDERNLLRRSSSCELLGEPAKRAVRAVYR